MTDFIRSELRRHRWIVPGLALTGSAALGEALPQLLAVIGRLL